MTILAHRGVTASAKDNAADALAAVAAAVAKGIPLGIEMDTHLALDDFVLNHDPFEGGIPLFDMPLSELRARLQGNSPITLTEGLKLLDGVPVINIELKEANTAKLAIEQVKRHCEETGQSLDAYMFVSFIPRAIAEVKQIDPTFITGMLIDEDHSRPLPSPDRVCLTLNREPSDEAIDLAGALWNIADHVGAEILSLHWTRLNRAVLEMAAHRNKHLMPWTVNNRYLMDALLERPEVKHIITDFPELVYPELGDSAMHRKLSLFAEAI